MELFATVIALAVGVIALLRYYATRQDQLLLILGAGFVGTAMLDGCHGILTGTAPDPWFPSPPSSLVSWSWNGSRTFLAVLMVCSWWVSRRRDRAPGNSAGDLGSYEWPGLRPERAEQLHEWLGPRLVAPAGEETRINERTVYAGMAALTLACFALFTWLPLLRADHAGLAFSRPLELMAGILFLTALIGFMVRGAWKEDVFQHGLILSLIAGVAAQFLFITRAAGSLDSMFGVAEGLKNVSYFSLLLGLLASTFQDLRRAGQGVAQLSHMNELLHRQVEERIGAENFARLAQTYAESIVATVPEPLLVLDKTLRVCSANPAYYRVFQVTEDETLNEPVFRLASGAWDDPQLREHMESLLTQQSGIDEVEIQHEFPVIGQRTMLVSARCVYRRPQYPEFLLMGIQDITKRRANERELRAVTENLENRVAERTRDLEAARVEALDMMREAQIAQVQAESAEAAVKSQAELLERSNDELLQFANIAAHDLQEPLRKVQAFGDRLKSTCAESLGDEGRDYLQRMQKSVERMQDLISDLLSYSRVTTKAKPFEPVNLNQIANEVLSDLELRIEQASAHTVVSDLPTIEADPTQMRQLLQNLIGNALKFCRNGHPPEIRIEASRVDGQQQNDTFVRVEPGSCEIRVIDNGIGFDEKYIDRIFRPFQRLHGRAAYEGTGMGLTICRKIVDRHGGQITAQSELEKGATFIVSLPLQQTVESE